jgi:TolB-like protein/Tfp pilus assembly protein PilF
MFTDIVGFTALMGSDEQKTLEILEMNRQIHKPIITAYNGRWIKELGDGVMATFINISDAINAAIKIMETCNAANEYQLCIGIHASEVVFENDDVFGDGVNIAARIQSAAPAGCILISETVQNSIANKIGIQTNFYKEEKLKNVSQSIRLHQVVLEGSEIAIADVSPSTNKSIAVLPFVNMSSDPEQEYFSDGISEEIINMLAQVPNLKVMARTSSFSFKGKHLDVKLIGQQLNVSHILEGSVRKSGNKLRITAQLIKVEDGAHIYSEKFDRELEDIFEIQDEISANILETIKIKLFGSNKEAVLKNYTENIDAYQLFLKGRYHYNKLTPSGFKEAIDYFKAAIAIDPNYTIAYAGLSYCYYDSYYWKWLPKQQSLPLAIEAANKAVLLDDQSADSHFALARINTWSIWNFTRALKELEKGIKINPNSVEGNKQLGAWHLRMGNYEKANNYLQKADDLDPFSLLNIGYIGGYYHEIGDFEKTIVYANRLIAMEPNFYFGHFLLGLVIYQNELNEALAESNLAVKLIGEQNIGALFSLGVVYGRMNEKEKAYSILKKMDAIGISKDETFYEYANVFAGLGEWDKAFEYYEHAIINQDPNMCFFKSKAQAHHPEMINNPKMQMLFELIDSKIK